MAVTAVLSVFLLLYYVTSELTTTTTASPSIAKADNSNDGQIQFVTACKGSDSVTLYRRPWGERVTEVNVVQTPGKINKDARLRVSGKGEVILSNPVTDDIGLYTFKIQFAKSPAVYIDRVLMVPEQPRTTDGQLHISRVPVPGSKDRVRLTCGNFTHLGYPPVSVMWQDPNGDLRHSTRLFQGQFIWDLPVNAAEGKYSCALSCDAGQCCMPLTSLLWERVHTNVAITRQQNNATCLKMTADDLATIGESFSRRPSDWENAMNESVETLHQQLQALEESSRQPPERGCKGERGSRGFPGLPGADGEPGLPGVPGQRGVQGTPGQKGENGDPGLRGPAGERGVQGTPGQKGEKGDQVLSGLPGLPGGKGMSRIPGLPGNPGEKGVKGEQGQKGERGGEGRDGLPGVPGLIGQKGESRDLGLPGAQGKPGVQGTPGQKGEKGDEGLPGLPGGKGMSGDPGLPGNPGEKGFKGEHGQKGEKGGEGRDGLPGLPGVTGEKGLSGEDGFPGAQGKPGVQGTPGQKGEKGDQGLPGLPGLPGHDGLPGLRGGKGMSGNPGLPGTPGENGFKGEQGQKGEKGHQGSTGLPGLKGEDGFPGQKGENGDPGLPGAKGECIVQRTPGQKGEKGDETLPGFTGFRGKRGIQDNRGQKGEPGSPGQDGKPGPAAVPDWLYRHCVVSSDCTAYAPDTQCVGSLCVCTPGYYYSVSRKICLSNCTQLQATYVHYPNSGITANNIHILEGMTVEQCLDACSQDPTCLTVERRRTDGKCHPQDVTPRDVPAAQWTPNDKSWDMYQKNCA